MTVSSRYFSSAASEKLDDFEALQWLGMLCGAGLLLSVLFVLNGWI
jgi:hypothetical protein